VRAGVPILERHQEQGLTREVVAGVSVPGVGDWSVIVGLTPWGHLHRVALRAWGCFADPQKAPAGWYVDQFRVALRPGLLWDQLALSRSLVDGDGQREVVLDRLAGLRPPTLIVWGDRDQILPVAHAHAAAARLPRGRLEIIPDCGHMPQVERPLEFLSVLEPFLAENNQLAE